MLRLQSFIFADREAGVSARQVRVDGAVAPQKAISRSSSHRSFKLSPKREETLPMYSPQPMRRSPSIRNTTRFPLKISSPMDPTDASKGSRDASGVTIPNLAHHPAMHSGHV